MRTADSGNDITGAPDASAIRPVANMPPRKSLFGLGMPTKTKIARVPGSVAGLMRSMRPVNLRSPKPSTVRSTVMPIFSSGMSTAGHHGLQFHLPQIDHRDERRVERDLLARLHVPLRDDARKRRVATASLSAFCARRTCASADMTLPRETLRLDSELSNAVCEMKFCFSSF